MPRDYTRDPIAIKKYCSCEFVAIHECNTVSEEDITTEAMDRQWKLVKVDDNCPLHSPDSRFDLPDGVM